MKKITICLFAVLILIVWMTPATAQSSLKFGLRGGLNLGNTSDDLPVDFDIPNSNLDYEFNRRMSSGGVIGGFVEYHLSPALSLQLNALYSQKGVKLETEVEGTAFEPDLGYTVNLFFDTKQTYTMDYYSVPLFIKYTFGRNTIGATRPYLMLGPEISFLDQAEAGRVTGDSFGYLPGLGGAAENIDVPGEDITDDLESTDLALNFGLGISFPLTSYDAFADIRYALGLSEVNKEGDPKYKNNVISLNVGVFF